MKPYSSLQAVTADLKQAASRTATQHARKSVHDFAHSQDVMKPSGGQLQTKGDLFSNLSSQFQEQGTPILLKNRPEPEGLNRQGC